ncbi:hypothetical protein NHX12_030719 [Muraenolepis orangiensis]|uniref:Uncharacterized protein n=1 Tax=Muraenolepis orangiensis TaxID=630683 RepID=A0A9Q0ECL6_9TELE|nr:hypothetical protein NHX12_030719 [Muraenolepis orangiensis]
MRLRDKPITDTPVDTDDQEDEMYSDEDELYSNACASDYRQGSFHAYADAKEPQPATMLLNPQIPALVPQTCRHCIALAYIVIDIPDPDMTRISPVGNDTSHVTTDPLVVETDNAAPESQESEPMGLRRSGRDRH